jgi:transposase-like protein
MTKKAPGKANREGIGLIELTEMFPDEAAAMAWFESKVWPSGRHCPRCGSTETKIAPASRGMPYWCPSCRKGFSVRIGTALERSRVTLRQWVIAIYLEMTSLKGVSSMKLHRDLKVTQKTAWFMLHRIREAWGMELAGLMAGPVEVDESYFGGREKNKHGSKKLHAGRGPVGKVAVAGVKDRDTNRVFATVVENTDAETLQGFIVDRAAKSATVYTDEHGAYRGLPFKHEAVSHSAGEYVKGMAHTQGIESFWSMLKRAHKGVYHKLSPKHLDRYVREFAGRHNVRERDTIDQMAAVVAGMVGKRLMYQTLIADNGRDSGARS